EKTHTVPEATPLYAPDDGVIAELGVREGASFTAGSPLFRINGLSTVWINAQVPESVAERFAPGAVVATRSVSWPGQVFAGRVVTAPPQIDAMTRTRIVRITVNNRDERLTPGMFVQSTFQDRAEVPQLWVPSEAVIVTGTRSVVITKRNMGSFAVVDVTTGTESNGETAILAGLTAGDSIVLSGQFLIDSEASLKSTLARLSGTGADVAEVHP
ncbi:MAG: efflux RND transporter periplasmic adaptor subunit, partial [Steroidobacteraceae bacterium]